MTTVERIIAYVAAVAVLGLGVFPIYKSAAADGKVTYCYVETERHMVPNQADVVVYSVYGFRPWRTDRRLSPALSNMEAVRKAASEYGCELK